MRAASFSIRCETRVAMLSVGINIGALTVKEVALRANGRNAKAIAHHGYTLEVLEELLALPGFADADYFGVSAQRGHISELAAIQRGLRELGSEVDAVVSLGGESFLVYSLANGKIANVVSHNKCAAGSSEFFVQQICRMGLKMSFIVFAPNITLLYSDRLVGTAPFRPVPTENLVWPAPH